MKPRVKVRVKVRDNVRVRVWVRVRVRARVGACGILTHTTIVVITHPWIVQGIDP